MIVAVQAGVQAIDANSSEENERLRGMLVEMEDAAVQKGRELAATREELVQVRKQVRVPSVVKVRVTCGGVGSWKIAMLVWTRSARSKRP